MKNTFAIIVLSLLAFSCGNKNESKLEREIDFLDIDYCQLLEDFEKSNIMKDTCPIEEKIQADKNLFFAESIEAIINSKITSIYDSSNQKIPGLPTNKKDYLLERTNWKIKIEKTADSILAECGTYYFCDVQSMEYRKEETKKRIQYLQNLMRSPTLSVTQSP
ncbi:MAG: hypothetical protein RL660_1751 [Bacteroidota bacterium]|jgi:hypothetical protein